MIPAGTRTVNLARMIPAALRCRGRPPTHATPQTTAAAAAAAALSLTLHHQHHHVHSHDRICRHCCYHRAHSTTPLSSGSDSRIGSGRRFHSSGSGSTINSSSSSNSSNSRTTTSTSSSRTVTTPITTTTTTTTTAMTSDGQAVDAVASVLRLLDSAHSRWDSLRRLKERRHRGGSEAAARAELRRLEAEMSREDFWATPHTAQRISRRHARLQEDMQILPQLQREMRDMRALVQMVAEEIEAEAEAAAAADGGGVSSGGGVGSVSSGGIPPLSADHRGVLQEAETACRVWLRRMEEHELHLLMTSGSGGPHLQDNDDDGGGGGVDDDLDDGDSAAQLDCYVEIHAGAGGTDSMDWAGMLWRMYEQWCARRHFEATVVDVQQGREAGVRSVTLHVRGEYAHGWLRTEMGVHRLVRVSPFDAAHKRHTSFASVTVYAAVADEGSGGGGGVEIRDKDLRVETMRAQGAGGQSVNKTESAVRITHLPTGIVASCQNDRSQHRNRETAMRVLRSRLRDLEMRRRRQQREQLLSAMPDNSFGSQIRSYVFHPYQLVKDHRTGIEVAQVDEVLDGHHLDQFMRAALHAQAHGQAQEQAHAER